MSVEGQDDALCLDCDSTFPLQVRGERCPECGSKIWVPANRPEDKIHDEFAGSKEVDCWDITHKSRGSVHPDVRQLEISTMDGWEYVLREPDPGTGFELFRKFRPDREQSEDDVLPKPVAEFIQEMNAAGLNYAKLTVHPSLDVYTPPDKEGDKR